MSKRASWLSDSSYSHTCSLLILMCTQPIIAYLIISTVCLPSTTASIHTDIIPIALNLNKALFGLGWLLFLGCLRTYVMWGDARRLSRKKGVNHKVEVNLLKGTEKDT